MYVYLREYKDPKQFFVDTISVTNAHYTYTPISNFFVVRTYIRALADTHTHTHTTRVVLRIPSYIHDHAILNNRANVVENF